MCSFSLFYVSCRPTYQIIPCCIDGKDYVSFSYFFTFFIIFRCDVETLQRSTKDLMLTSVRAEALSFSKAKDVVLCNDSVHFLLCRRFSDCCFYDLTSDSLELFLIYLCLDTRFGFINAERVPRESVFGLGKWVLDLREATGWGEVRCFVWDLPRGDVWGEGADFVGGARGVRGVEREGYFILLRARGRRRFKGDNLKLVATSGDLELWRVCVWERWGRDRAVCLGRCTHPYIGDRFRRKQPGEVRTMLAQTYRYC